MNLQKGTVPLEKQESELKVYKTENYSLFSLISANREILPEKVKEFELMIENGYPQDECPILVTQKLEILDGQHRFMAAKSKKTPVFYIISRKSSESNAMIDINKLSNGWKLEDYVRFHAQRGNGNYKSLMDFCKSNKISCGIAAACFGFRRKRIKKVLISGEFVFDEDKKIHSESWISKYREFLSRCVMSGEKNITQMAQSFSFFEAVLSTVGKKENFFEIIFDHRHIVNHCSGFRGYILQFVSISCCDEQ